MVGIDVLVLVALVVALGVVVLTQARELRRRSAALPEAADHAAQRTLAEAVLTMASDPFVATDEHGTIVDWNRAAQTLLGWHRDDVIGRDVVDLLIPDRTADDSEQMRDLWLGRLFRAHEPIEAAVRRRDGGELPVEATAWTVQVGRTRQLNVLMRDVTERKQAEHALREARERALDASRLKSEFLATMSHEIRTPMNGVIGLSGLMLETELDQTQRRYVEGIRTAGDALLSVINDVLDFSKVEAGKLSLVETEFDLRELVADVVEVVAEPARSRGLELLGDVRPGVPVALRGDPGRLRQVLLNLASNAVKFTEQGEVVVRAERADTGAGSDLVIRFEVRDTGMGIPPEQADRMFDAFSQVDASTTRGFGGTGLGLAICRRLVDLMKGRIGVVSQPGQGSTFWTEIPLRRQENRANAGAARTRDLVGLRVLVVDNNATNRVILEEQMRAWRMSPTTVDSSAAALDELHRASSDGHGYDLAVLDMYLPGMDGVELAQRISTDPGIPAIFLLLLTSGPSTDVPGAQAAGIQACLTKPVHQSELFDSLARMIGHGRVTPRAEPAQSTEERTGTPAGPSTARILLAEDNDINQQVAAAILTRFGYQVDPAADGREALDRAAHNTYDAILMDCQMPVMDGYAATEELREREGSGRHTPVIALTASARAEDRDRCLAAGMDDYLAKPIRPEQLEQILERWIGASTMAEPDPHVRDQIAGRLTELRSFDPAGGDSLVRGLVESFLEKAPSAVSAIDEELSDGDCSAAGVQAHKLQGMAGNLGAVELAEASGDVCQAAREGWSDPGQLERLHEELDLAVAAVRDFRARL